MALTEIKTSGIADDAVTLAKQAGGTDGQIITFDASGNPVAVGPGTDGQVLTSTGAGSPPAFEAAAGGGGGKLLNVVQQVNTAAAASGAIAANTEWDTGMTVTITPAATSSKVLLEGVLNMCGEANHLTIGLRLKSDSGGSQAILSGTTPSSPGSRLSCFVGESSDWNDEVRPIAFKFLDSPNKASAVIYKVYAVHSGHGDGDMNLYINRSDSDTDAVSRGRMCSVLLATEIGA